MNKEEQVIRFQIGKLEVKADRINQRIGRLMNERVTVDEQHAKLLDKLDKLKTGFID